MTAEVHKTFSHHTRVKCFKAQGLVDISNEGEALCSRIAPAFSAFRVDVSFTVKSTNTVLERTRLP